MHIFLTGPKHIGKSTTIQKIVGLLGKATPLSLGGFLTYWGGDDGACLYIADAGGHSAPVLAATRGDSGTVLRPQAFDVQGAALLRETQGAQLILMDELGFLEKDCTVFQQSVLACLEGGIPVLGVLRDGHILWHEPIKAHRHVAVYEVGLENRDRLPALVASVIQHVPNPHAGCASPSARRFPSAP